MTSIINDITSDNLNIKNYIVNKIWFENYKRYGGSDPLYPRIFIDIVYTGIEIEFLWIYDTILLMNKNKKTKFITDIFITLRGSINLSFTSFNNKYKNTNFKNIIKYICIDISSEIRSLHITDIEDFPFNLEYLEIKYANNPIPFDLNKLNNNKKIEKLYIKIEHDNIFKKDYYKKIVFPEVLFMEIKMMSHSSKFYDFNNFLDYTIKNKNSNRITNNLKFIDDLLHDYNCRRSYYFNINEMIKIISIQYRTGTNFLKKINTPPASTYHVRFNNTFELHIYNLNGKINISKYNIVTNSSMAFTYKNYIKKNIVIFMKEYKFNYPIIKLLRVLFGRNYI